MSTRIKYLVVARNKNAADDWAERNQIPLKECKYASAPHALYGINNIQVVYLPNWQLHRDSVGIYDQIRLASIGQMCNVTEAQICDEIAGCDGPICEEAKYLAMKYCKNHRPAKVAAFWEKVTGDIDVNLGSKEGDQPIFKVVPGPYRYKKLLMLVADLDTESIVVFIPVMVRLGRQRHTRACFNNPGRAITYAHRLAARFERIYY